MRQPAPAEPEGEEQVQARRQTAPESPEEPDTIAAAREEEEAQRQAAAPEEQEEETSQAARYVRRQTTDVGEEMAAQHSLTPEDLEPAAAPPLDAPTEEEPVTDVRTLRRATPIAPAAGVDSPSPAQGPPQLESGLPAPSAHHSFADVDSQSLHQPAYPVEDRSPFDFLHSDYTTSFASHASGSLERPRVTIEQLDVLIHEPPPAAAPKAAHATRRALRARYLGRL